MSELHLINQLQMAAIRRDHKVYFTKSLSLRGSICIVCTHQTLCMDTALYSPSSCEPPARHTVQCPLCHIAPSRLRHSPHQFSHQSALAVWAPAMAALSKTQLPMMTTSHMSPVHSDAGEL